MNSKNDHLALLGELVSRLFVEGDPRLAEDNEETHSAAAGSSTEVDTEDVQAGASVPASDSTPRDVALVVEQPVTPQIDDRGTRMLGEIRKFASWAGPDGLKRLKEVKQVFEGVYPGNSEAVDDAVERGLADANLMTRAYKEAASYGRNAQQLRQFRAEAETSGLPFHRLEASIAKGVAAYERRKGARAKERSGAPLSNVKPRGKSEPAKTVLFKEPLVARRGPSDVPEGLHANDLRALTPAPSWRILIDETGSEFGPEAQSGRRLGRFVAVVLRTDVSILLPLPARWHAAECTEDAAIDRVFQAVLEAEVGVLGICANSLPVTQGERWMDGVGMLVDWILRLLPLDGHTTIEVLVENRGVFTRGQTWDLVARESLRKLAISFPQRAATINLVISVIDKEGSPLNGYADALAFTWARTSPSSKVRLRQSGLLESCLLENSARELLHTWDAFTQGVELPPATWWMLVGSPEIRRPASLPATFLEIVGQECRADESRWSRFLTETRSRMAVGAVDLAVLSLAVEWLQRFQPVESRIPQKGRLSWLTVQLARSNHFGAIESGWMDELEKLAPELIEEAAPLVCNADLHRSVAFTNRFDFENAQKALEKWKEFAPAVPGLGYWGQVQSSFGQHAAFQGRYEAAIGFFDTALDAFQRLSDPVERNKEIAQTACYRAIALMDTQGADSNQIRESVERVTGPVAIALQRLHSDQNPANRYAHHLLLRWLVNQDDEQLKNGYLSNRQNWEEDDGHPWPLIQLYRGMLLEPTDRAGAVELAIDGADRAFASEQGPTVKLIGACCRTVAFSWGSPWPESSKVFDSLASELPLAGDRVVILSRAMNEPLDPLGLLRSVLPFNFR